MALTPESNNTVDTANDLTEKTAVEMAITNELTPDAPEEMTAPEQLPQKAAAIVATPRGLTPKAPVPFPVI